MEEPGRNCDNCDIRNSVRVLVSVSLNLKQGCFSVVIETTRGYDVRRKILANRIITNISMATRCNNILEKFQVNFNAKSHPADWWISKLFMFLSSIAGFVNMIRTLIYL